MNRKHLVTLPAVVLLLELTVGNHARAFGGELLANFGRGIGVDPVGSVALPVNADGTFQNVSQNIVRGVTPGGRPWTIADLTATVDTDGRIRVNGRGLLIAGGDRIGQSLQLQVGATLICESSLPFTQHNTAGTVTLDENGDFRIDDVLQTVPSDCPSPLLLIRANGTGPWLAAGIPVSREDR